jgi:hypothetical protein
LPVFLQNKVYRFKALKATDSGKRALSDSRLMMVNKMQAALHGSRLPFSH